ncbi:hypothetical protein DL762_007802 [Monosporascus cannonballus]|uniref:CFEM domain-containing protein n=1 Tax=Monosporascus cannonballus TaxID=155416 RepID=A0ABY0H2B0_9PEZI|nr:hypothetical protein DL762_007802 [Monosporascus cannonballus]
MKNTASLVALAAGLSQVTATGYGFINAPKFSAPHNSDSFCLPDWKGGFDWADLTPGKFDSYKGFKWGGFTCEDKFSKRDELAPRAFTQDKCISGKATKDKKTSPFISCDKSKGSKKTSIKEFHVQPEFDCDLEFHYTMPDGSSCKHRSRCSKSGTKVKNTQCGGAIDVVITYPEQPDIPDKDGCHFGIPSVIFDCETASKTSYLPSATTSSAVNTPPPVSVTTSSSAGVTTSSASHETSTYPGETPSSVITTSSNVPVDSTTSSAGVETTSSAVESVTKSSTTESSATESSATESYPTTAPSESTTSSAGVETTSSAVESVTTSSATESATESYPTTAPPESTTSSAGVETTSSAVESVTKSSATESSATESYPTESSATESYPTTAPPESATSSAGVETTSSAVESATSSSATSATTFTSVTSYMTTSTVYSTIVSTITSCGPTVTNCPAGEGETATVTSTVAISTTICPVTETFTSVSTPVQPETSATEKPSGETPVPSATTATSPGEDSTSATSPPGPIETLPCPEVVPQCLNTWLDTIGCKDNTDSACYCPSKDFVDNVFDCLYSHGESEEAVQEAITYFQGICAPHAPENPGIVTYPETITKVFTATPTHAPTAVYTTIELVTTAVVPCTGTEGESSSSTVVISTTVSVPDIGFTTVTDSPGTTAVAIVPGPTAPVAITQPSQAPSTKGPEAPVYPTQVPTDIPVYPTSAFTTLTTPAPIGTGSFYPTGTAPPIATAGAARMGAGVGIAGVLAFVVAAF